MAVKSEPSNDDEFKMSKDKPEESSIIRKDILWIIWTFFNVFPSETYETIKLFILHMLMSILKGRLQGRNLRGGKMWIIYLLLLCGMPLSAAYAYIPGCSPSSRSRNDSILDADDVKEALFEEITRCNFSHQGYEHVCEDAFHGMTCEIIELTGNRLSNLSSTVFQNVVNLREVFLDGNKFVVMPKLINGDLEFLSMNKNPLEQFSNNSTIGLPNLITLSVENCPNLSAIDLAAFEKNDKLKRLRFSGTLEILCSNCLTLEGPDTVYWMCRSGSANVTSASVRGEIVIFNKTVEMFLKTNDSSSSICKNKANSHSTTPTSTPTSFATHSTTPTSTPTSFATSTSAKPNSAPWALITAIILLLYFFPHGV